MPKLTDTFIRGLRCETRQEFKDDIVNGLWLRVGAGDKGSKTWVFRFRKDGAQCSVTLGKFSDLGLKNARLAAEAVRSGESIAPVSGKGVAKGKLFAEVAEDMIASRDFQKKKTADDIARTIRTGIVPFVGSIEIGAFKRKDAKDLIAQYMDADKEAMARRVQYLTAQVLNYAVEEEVINYSVMAGMRMPAKIKSRTRFLSRDELKSFWEYLNTDAAKSDPMRRAIRWIFVTGQRRSECLYITGEEVDFSLNRWTLSEKRAKNGISHVLPLTEWHMELLGKPGKNNYFFPNAKPQYDVYDPRSLTHHINDYCAMRGIEPNFTAHDLRRTMTTYLAEMQVPLNDIKRVLNHKFTDVTSQHYDMYAYIPQKLTVMEKWRDFITSL